MDWEVGVAVAIGRGEMRYRGILETSGGYNGDRVQGVARL